MDPHSQTAAFLEALLIPGSEPWTPWEPSDEWPTIAGANEGSFDLVSWDGATRVLVIVTQHSLWECEPDEFNELTFSGVNRVVLPDGASGFAMDRTTWSKLPDWMRTSIYPTPQDVRADLFAISARNEREKIRFLVEAKDVTSRRRLCGRRWRMLANLPERREALIGVALEGTPGRRATWELLRLGGLPSEGLDPTLEGTGYPDVDRENGTLRCGDQLVEVTFPDDEADYWEARWRRECLEMLVELGVMPTSTIADKLEGLAQDALRSVWRAVYDAEDRNTALEALGGP